MAIVRGSSRLEPTLPYKTVAETPGLGVLLIDHILTRLATLDKPGFSWVFTITWILSSLRDPHRP